MMILIENLKLDFPGRLDLSIDRLLIEEGKVCAIIGPNGAGKSTLLNIIALFQRPDHGTVEIRGTDILKLKDITAFRRGISFVFSQLYLFNDTVYNNIALPLRLRGERGTRAVDEMLDLFKIRRLIASKAPILSQGEKHRVALARAFVTKPDLILLDEPFLSLDAEYKESLINDLRRVTRANGITAIFVTQDQVEALSLADTMAVMIDGRILQHSRAGDIFTRPVSREVADFVGVETILKGVISKKEENLCYIKVKDRILEAVSEYGEGDNVFVCIRPEDIIISRHEDTTSARNHFKAKIIDIKPWRLECKLNLDCGFSLIACVTKQSIEDMGLRAGDDIFASFKATAVHLIRGG